MTSYQVLIVDDQRDVARMLHAAFETLPHNFVVTVVPSGEEAFLEARLKKFDLLVTDFRLPGMSGIELLTRLRTRNPAMRIIIITGAVDSKSRKEVVAAGADAYFYKPIEIPDFLDGVESVLGLIAESAPPPTKPAVSAPAASPPAQSAAPPPSSAAKSPAAPADDHVAAFVADADNEAPSEKRISDRLAALRQALSASLVIMLDERGQVLVRAGEFPNDNFESGQIPVIMASFAAGQKLSLVLGQQTPRNFQLSHGIDYDVCIASVGLSYALVTLGRELTLDHNLNRVMSSAVTDLLNLLLNIGVSFAAEEVKTAAPFVLDIDEIEEESLAAEDEGLLALFSQSSEALGSSSLDDFWGEPARIEESSPIFDSGVITYEQALQLGLAPGEDEEDSARKK